MHFLSFFVGESVCVCGGGGGGGGAKDKAFLLIW